MQILSKNSNETVKLGEEIGKKLSGGEVIALYGDLGGGKTQFAKGIARGLGIKDNIISPTFVIRREYRLDSRRMFTRPLAGGNDKEGVIRRSSGKKLNLLHYDFYRFEVPDRELVESMEEGINPDNVTVIEWAERVEKYLPKDAIKITFKYISENEREIEITPGSQDLEDKFSKLSF